MPTDGSFVVVGQISVGAPLQAGWVARYTAEGTLVWWKDDISPDASVATTAKGIALRVTNGVGVLVGGRALTTDWTAWIRGYRDDGSFGSFAEFTYGGPGNTTFTSNGFVLAANSDLFMGGESGGIRVGKFAWDPIAKADRARGRRRPGGDDRRGARQRPQLLVRGPLERDPADPARWRFHTDDDAEGGACDLTLVRYPDRVELAAEGCRYYCGARAYLDGIFPVPGA